jgi:DNA-binding beta-propeller fold protein YncE
MKTGLRLLALLAVPSAVLLFPPAAPVLAAPVDPRYHLVRTIPLPGADGWDYMTADAANHRLYVSRGTHVAVVDTETGKPVGDIPDTTGVHGIALDPKDGRGFTSNGRANSVTIFDLKTLKKIGEAATGDGPDAIVYEPVTGRVFTFNGRAGTATAIDAANGTVVGTVALPGRPEFPVADVKGHLYDNIEDKSEIVSIDAKTLKVDAVWPLAPAESPSGLAMDRKHRRLFAVCDNQKLAVVDADSGKLVGTPAIGSGPDACAFDPDQSLVFSPNGEDGTMTVLREVTPDQYETVATLTTQAGARTMALDEKTHRVFTVTAKTIPPTPGETGRRRRQYVDGSFVILEYAPGK